LPLAEYTLQQISDLVADVLLQCQLDRLWQRLLTDAERLKEALT